MTARRLFVHAGLHKTGTTALQAALAAGCPQGLLYPAVGRPPGLDGHHAIAWQLTGDPRYRADDGSIDAVAAEIAAFDGDALLSSEDFEGVLRRPRRLRRLTRHRLLRQHGVTLLIAVRGQASYADALVREMQHHGMDAEASAVCETILADGVLRFGAWSFLFDYAALRRRLRWAGLDCVIRPYAAPAAQEPMDNDLLAAIGYRVATARLNRRDALVQDLARFCACRLGLDADALHAALAGLIGAALQGRQTGLGAARRAAFARRFGAGNARLAQRCGWMRGLAEPAPGPGWLDLEAVFAAPVAALVGAWQQGRLTDQAAAAALLSALGVPPAATSIPQERGPACPS